MLLSVVLSWRFTGTIEKMKNIAERLAERDYTARTDIKQNDEIGELARTLDILADVWSWQMPKAKSWKSCAASYCQHFARAAYACDGYPRQLGGLA